MINLPDIARKAAREAGIPYKWTLTVLKSAFSVIADEVADGETVRISGFGRFEMKQRAARNARDLDGGTIRIPPRDMPVFKPSDNFTYRRCKPE